jgi:hypothetical protein
MQIWKEYNKRTKRYEWRARFRLNKITFRPKEETKTDLLDVIAEIRRQENSERIKEQINKKYQLGLEVVSYIPTVAELFEKVLPSIPKDHQRKFLELISVNYSVKNNETLQER